MPALSSNKVRLLGLCGMLAALAFTLADVLGSLLTPSYSAWSDAISELVQKGAARKSLLDPLLTVYHALVIPFSVGVGIAVYHECNRRLGPILLGAAGAIGVSLTLFFPCDPGCEPFVSVTGTLHIFLAIPMGIAIVVAIWLIGNGMRSSQRWRGLAFYSRATACVGILLAATTVALAETEHVGVLERALTYSYLQWYFVLGAAIVSNPSGQ